MRYIKAILLLAAFMIIFTGLALLSQVRIHYGETIAVRQNGDIAINNLITSGASIDQLEAALNHDPSVAKRVLITGHTLLLSAVHYDRMDAALLLLQHGANPCMPGRVEKEGPSRPSAMESVAVHGQLEFVRLFLSKHESTIRDLPVLSQALREAKHGQHHEIASLIESAINRLQDRPDPN
ncbi:MAG: hypothetical protein KF699_12280 [Phycisphaeraceae bacterium]|nr:hypothetical protein [Fimbriimonadaceae bacterium]MBX3404177.1 hypothetical protein [Phycisphaeraceae bacterium]